MKSGNTVAQMSPPRTPALVWLAPAALALVLAARPLAAQQADEEQVERDLANIHPAAVANSRTNATASGAGSAATGAGGASGVTSGKVWVRQPFSVANPVVRGPAWAGWELAVDGETSATFKGKDPQGNARSIAFAWEAPPPEIRPGQVITLKCRAQSTPSSGINASFNFEDFSTWMEEGSYKTDPPNAAGCSSSTGGHPSWPAAYSVTARVSEKLVQKESASIIVIVEASAIEKVGVRWVYRRQGSAP